MFIKKAAAHDITARIVYGGQSLQVAADSVLREMTQLGVGAGFAAVDAHGTPYAPYNTIGMCGCSFFFLSMRSIAMLSPRLGCCCVSALLKSHLRLHCFPGTGGGLQRMGSCLSGFMMSCMPWGQFKRRATEC
jgi:hypothetical protein